MAMMMMIEKKKGPVDIDWNTIMYNRGENEASVVEIVRMVGSPSEEQIQKQQQEIDTISSYSDHELKDKIARLRQLNNGTAIKLPDKGEKLKKSLMLHEQEFEQRILSKEAIQEAECAKSRSSAVCNGDSSDPPSFQAQPQSTFGSIFSENLEDEPDLNSRITVHPSSKALSLLPRGNNQNRRSNGLPLNKGRREIKTSSRQSPLQSHKLSSCDRNEHRSPIGPRKGIDASTFYHPHRYGKSAKPAKRRKVSQVQTSKQSGTKELETVVVVDEEDCQPTETTHLEDESVKREEATIYYPSRNDPESVELRYSDMNCLAPPVFLSSTIMNFYIRYLQRPVSATGRSRRDYHFFNTYFYGKIKEAVSCKENDKVTFFSKFRRWWKGVNIFEKAYILLPIHENYHWSLVIICLPNKEDESGPILLHLDSLGYHDSNEIFENVKSFLKEEWNYLNGLNQTGVPPNLPIAEKIWKNLPRRIEDRQIKVPQQKNDYDCGVFVLFFMERFIEEAPERLKKKDLDMFSRTWFKPEQASKLRVRIRNLLKEEFEKPMLEIESKEPSPTSSDTDSAGCTMDLSDS